MYLLRSLPHDYIFVKYISFDKILFAVSNR